MAPVSWVWRGQCAHRPAGSQILQFLAKLLDWPVRAVSKLLVCHGWIRTLAGRGSPELGSERRRQGTGGTFGGAALLRAPVRRCKAGPSTRDLRTWVHRNYGVARVPVRYSTCTGTVVLISSCPRSFAFSIEAVVAREELGKLLLLRTQELLYLVEVRLVASSVFLRVQLQLLCRLGG